MLQFDLSHISGPAVVEGSLEDIVNLLELLYTLSRGAPLQGRWTRGAASASVCVGGGLSGGERCGEANVRTKYVFFAVSEVHCAAQRGVYGRGVGEGVLLPIFAERACLPPPRPVLPLLARHGGGGLCAMAGKLCLPTPPSSILPAATRPTLCVTVCASFSQGCPLRCRAARPAASRWLAERR